MSINNRANFSLLAAPTRVNNFCPQLSAKLTTSGTSGSITFSPVTGLNVQTFKIANKGTEGAYIAWGAGSATAVASSGTPAAQCDYIQKGQTIIQDFQLSTGVVDTIAAIQDGGATTLEITIGFGS